MTTGFFKFGDVESGATMLLKVRFKIKVQNHASWRKS